MTLKLHQILAIEPVLSRISLMELSAQKAYEFSKILVEVKTNVEYYNAHLNLIANIYGEKDSDGQLLFSDNGELKLANDTAEEAITKLQELRDVEIQWDYVLNIADFGDILLTPRDMECLLPMIL